MSKITNRFTVEQLQWLAALESGKFRKAYNSLCNRDKSGNKGYCCLGVGAVVLSKLHPNDIKLEYVEDEKKECMYVNSDRGSERNFLDAGTTDLLYLVGSEGEFLSGHEFEANDFKGNKQNIKCLSNLNDMLRWSHRKIAAWIRKNPHVVFLNFNKAPNSK